MHLKRLILILIPIFSLTGGLHAQEKTTQIVVKADSGKTVVTASPKSKSELVKSVPVKDRNLEAIKQQNLKASREQVQTINKAIRKSMRVNRRR